MGIERANRHLLFSDSCETMKHLKKIKQVQQDNKLLNILYMLHYLILMTDEDDILYMCAVPHSSTYHNALL